MAFDNGRGALATVLTQFAENNAWSNYRTHAACASLDDDAYFAPRPSFFGSTHATLDHILIVDLLYIGRTQSVARVANDAAPLHDDRHALREAQAETDRELVALCRGLDDEALKRQVGYRRHDGTACDESVANLLKHLFVHQIHHRGQVHGLLSATSVEPPQLDEFFLVSDRPLREKELDALGLQPSPEAQRNRDGLQVAARRCTEEPSMFHPIRLIGLLLWFTVTASVAASSGEVQFHSASYPPTPFKIKLARKKGIDLVAEPGPLIAGTLSRPDGDGPFPAVVLMHGCAGIGRWNRLWTERLVGWGYVVLDVDSLGPRGERYICGRPTAVPAHDRALDAHGAKAYLSTLAEVDPTRIAVIGMSHGGWSVLRAVNAATTSGIRSTPFAAAVALYPWCDEPATTDTRLLILTGANDDWTPAERCERFLAGHAGTPPVTVRIYPGAHHLFDVPGMNLTEQGHVLRYDEAAATDAAARVKAFLPAAVD